VGFWSVPAGYSATPALSTSAVPPVTSQDVASGTSRPTLQEAALFLEHSTWGPTAALIERVQEIGYERFLEEQFEAPMSSYPTLPLYPNVAPADCPGGSTCRRDNYSMYPLQTRFFTNALYGPDQLRQRLAFALHQIIVVSGVEIRLPGRMAPYLQILDRNAFGNFRRLLYEITLNPAMGNYLDMAGNNRTNPNENYAREILQLFSVGLLRLHPDGTPQTDNLGETIPTYDQQVVNAFARVFTGWNFAAAPARGTTNYIDPLVPTQNRHDIGTKTLLRGVTLPANQTAAKDLSDALDNIFTDPNVGPFIGKQLIQHLVTSNPSSAYVRRVSAAFDDNGQGVRGDLRAVVKAILLDEEALTAVIPDGNSGHLKHPVLLITNLLRLFSAVSADGSKTSDGYLNPQAVNMGMDLFRPPSVFSYFSPSTGVAGTSLKGPEFGLLNTSSAMQRANFVNTMVFSRIARSANAPNGTSLKFSGLQTIADRPGEMVEILNAVMMGGRMSSEMAQAIVAAVEAVPVTNPLRRVQTAVYLIATSAQYQVER
jgi:uncharacterized protein (DUF1800 family)